MAQSLGFRVAAEADIQSGMSNASVSTPPVSAVTSDDLRPLLAQVAAGRSLSESEAETAFEIIMSGNATPSQIGPPLMALRVRGETGDELTAAARIMRSEALTIHAPRGAIDAVGTGGDAPG